LDEAVAEKNENQQKKKPRKRLVKSKKRDLKNSMSMFKKKQKESKKLIKTKLERWNSLQNSKKVMIR